MNIGHIIIFSDLDMLASQLIMTNILHYTAISSYSLAGKLMDIECTCPLDGRTDAREDAEVRFIGAEDAVDIIIVELRSPEGVAKSRVSLP